MCEYLFIRMTDAIFLYATPFNVLGILTNMGVTLTKILCVIDNTLSRVCRNIIKSGREWNDVGNNWTYCEC